MKQSSKNAYAALGLMIVAYAMLTFLVPPDPEALNRYHISTIQLRLIQLTIVLPVALIWFIATYGYIRFRDYARSIKKTTEGKAIGQLVKGIGVLAISLPLTSLASTLSNIVLRTKPEYVRWSTLFSHYLVIVLMLIAFRFIYSGARHLQDVTPVKQSAKELYILLIGFSAFAATYVYLLLSNPVKDTGDPKVVGQTIFFLPDWVLLLTLVIPYLYVWFIGLRACVFLNNYQRGVSGIIYKKALYFLALGIGAVVAGSISRQYLVAVSNLLLDLRLGALLVLVYSLLIVIAAGYVLIGIGARKLQLIEEV